MTLSLSTLNAVRFVPRHLFIVQYPWNFDAGGRFPPTNLVYLLVGGNEMNDDLERLEDLCKDIVKFRAGNPTRAQLWDVLERLGQEFWVLATAPRKGL